MQALSKSVRTFLSLVLALIFTLACVSPAAAATLRAGDHVTFGTYYQYDGWDDPIVWRVLDVRKDKALLISEEILYARAFDSGNRKTNWEDSTLRWWLNNDFYSDAFSSSEQASILTTSVLCEKSVVTSDKLFLLSKDEVVDYFNQGKPSRIGYATAYAASTGTWVSKNGEGWWWTRTMSGKAKAMFVTTGGVVQTSGTEVYNPGGIRPAMWVSLR